MPKIKLKQVLEKSNLIRLKQTEIKNSRFAKSDDVDYAVHETTVLPDTQISE